MTQQIGTAQLIETLEAFLTLFNAYLPAMQDSAKPLRVTKPKDQRVTSPEEILTQLRRTAPKVTVILLQVIGNSEYSYSQYGRHTRVSMRDLLSNALTNHQNFIDWRAAVTNSLDKAIGTLDAGLWPSKTPEPVLIIRDSELRERCTDLLNAPGNHDRVVREATTVMEDRIRRRPPIEALARVIPNSADQSGDNLVNKLFSPDKPVLSVSSDRTRRIALHRMLLGVVSYLRNPYHHQLDDQTHQSWAWSAVGLIDRLLADIDSCTVEKT